MGANMTKLTPYLAAKDASAAIDFYLRAFGATETSRWTERESGKIGHAEVSIGEVRIFLADEWSEGGVYAPSRDQVGGHSVSLVLEVDDADAVFDRAVEAGATVERPVTDQPYGARGGWLIDPAGHRWSITTPGVEASPEELRETVGDQYDVR